ncbi:cysteine hydrolase family protein [Mucilaginibacter sp. X4EP1]|uniref:cysteine hydrolase family protein n=1 Tax=Mucilaginibacter sp. X4EP1 TaxID=2723092 RepID=UPI002167D8A3|nr:isochorismatase family cysteine hydrolase [Mucilaginibacter sp. X4EP1]MCS3812731.1 nicotinamidase-related amidase [Mucilaginibacter sp. X4EP1]
MKVLIVIDAQNEFSANGKRPVPDHLATIETIEKKVNRVRKERGFIAWIRHFNKPNESAAFVPGTWGAQFVGSLGPQAGSEREVEFIKDVYGAFTGTEIGSWLQQIGADEVEITGFYTHGCVSTTSREAIMAGFAVYLDINGTASCAITHEVLGDISADEVRRSALLQLANMGAFVYSSVLAQVAF